MQYILVHFERAGDAYQEIINGNVSRYLDTLGVEMFVNPPVADSCNVVDASPREIAWMTISPPPLSNLVRSQALTESSPEELTVELARR